MSKKINTVLFDLDETLLDRTSSLRRFASWQARGILRNSITDEKVFCDRFIELDSNGAVWKDKVYRKLSKEFRISEWTVEELLENYLKCFRDFCSLKKHAYDALVALKESGYYLGLVSNGKSPFQERNFNALGVSHLFGATIVSDAVGLRKPDPAIFHLACNKLGTTPDKTIFVGDNPTVDIVGANAVGMYTVYIPGYFGNDCVTANVVCANFRDLCAIVENAALESKPR